MIPLITICVLLSPPKVQQMINTPGNWVATFDMCRFGLKSPSGIPMKKRTKFLTNLKGLYTALDGCFCDGTHTHEAIQGSECGTKRSTFAQTYPDGFVSLVCETVLHENRCSQRGFEVDEERPEWRVI